MNILGIIPARYGSTRFPGKPLVMIGEKSMIERVYLQASQSKKLNKIIVATDDDRIASHVKSFGGDVMMTSENHLSGTDRCAEVLFKAENNWKGVVNIQGDEPFINPAQIDLLVDCLMEDGVQIATLIKEINNQEELFNPNLPKVIVGKNGDAIYFSRQALPFLKGIKKEEWHNKHLFYKHIGIYGYRSEILPELTKLPQGKLEIAESLEQLRWIENGFKIKTRLTTFETIAIDTPEDLERAISSVNSVN